MKLKLLLFAVLSVLSTALYSQIKIGDNPQNLDPASVLELESTNRVFVITRITTVEMNAILPLQGAMVYNTDEQCLYYYDGTEWINLCDALRLTFTSDPIFNDYSTIVITESEDNVNFEVREIRGQNIVDFTITSVDIQNNAITSSKLAPDSVGNEELQDNTVSDAEIDYSQVTLNDFTNDAGFITSASIVSTDAGNTIIAGSDNGAFYDVTPVQNALNALDVAVTTISLIDNGDGTYNFTDSDGNIITILDTSISTLIDLNNGTYTYTDETGLTETIDTNAASNPYNNAASGLTATDVQAAIDEINALAGTVALVDNLDGTYDFTDAAGNTTIITDTSISTLVDNLDGTYTYTDESGTTQLIDTNAGSNPYDNTASGLTATDVQAAIDEINALAGTVALVDNLDGTYDFTDAAGNTTIITDTSISTLVDNLDGTYTYTDETGTTQLIDTNAGSNPYDNTASGLTATDVQAAIDEINALAGTVALVDNLDGTYDFTDAAGNTTIITDTSISTLVDNADGTYTYTDESGATQIIDTNASSNPYDNTFSGLAATNVQEAIDIVSTAVAGGSDDQNILGSGLSGTDLTIGIENGTNEVVNLSSLVESVIAGTGAISVTDDGNGNYTVNSTDLDEDLTNELNTGIAMVAGALEITDASGPLSENLISGDLNNNLSAGSDGRLYLNVDTEASGETITNLVDNGDGTVTYTNENGVPQTFTKADLVDVGDGTYTFTNNGGVDVITIDTRAGSNFYNDAISGLGATNVQDAIDVLAGGVVVDGSETIVTGAGINAVSGTGTAGDPYIITGTEVDGSVTNEINTAFQVNAGNLEIIDSNGTLTVPLASIDTDDQTLSIVGDQLSIADGNTVTIPTPDGSETVVTGAGINAVSGTGTAGDPYIITGTEIDGSVTNEINTAFQVNAGNLEIIDSNGTLTVPLASIDTDDQTLSIVGDQLSIADGNTVTIPTPDGSETVVTGAGINAVSGTGTAGDPYIITGTEIDGSVTNEINTAFQVNAGNLEIIDSNGTLTVPLASIDTDDQTLSIVGDQLSIADGNTVTIPTPDGSETVVTGAGINAVSGTGTAGDPYIITGTEIDGSVTNEINTAFQVNAGNLEIIDSNGTLTVPLASIDTDDQTLSIVGDQLSIADGNTVTIPTPDGSETVVTGAGINAVSGTGTAGDPYIITGTEIDGSVTNEINTAFQVNAGNLEIIDSNGTLTVPLASIDTDDQTLSIVGDQLSIADGNTVTIPTPDGSETIVTGAGINVVTGTGTTADPYIITATEVQTAAQVSYNPATSGLSAINTQAAIDEIAALNPGANLSNQNLTQTINTYRDYGLNGGDVVFSGGLGENVGIGAVFNPANQPSEKLDVDGNIRARQRFFSGLGSQSNPNFGFSQDTNTDSGMYRSGENIIGFSTGATQAMILDAEQEVGINVNSPSSRLHMNGSFANNALRSTSSATLLTDTDYTVIITNSAHNITLPLASSANGRIYILKNTTVSTVSISSFLNQTSTPAVTIQPTSVLWLQSDGTNWHQIN